MYKNFNNTKGFALIGILLAVVIIAVLFYGGTFFFQKDNPGSPQNAINTVNQAEDDINKVNQIIEERNETSFE